MKELVIQPQLSSFFLFFDHVSSTSLTLKDSNLSDDQKAKVVDELKGHLSLLRKQLIDLLLSVNIDLHNAFRNSLDNLIDEITVTAFSQNVDLSLEEVYSNNITNKILDVKKILVERILNYRGN